ncbi:hypothetical protein SSX86_017914 [Deinandra increscens subsp. villosa]|uniref:Myosin motor domain-containing protein n=1 Tax=Deinandra increscens subsp. villosa TaxID=3103831 RepID=A0AAP0D0W6_9ASTR
MPLFSLVPFAAATTTTADRSRYGSSASDEENSADQVSTASSEVFWYKSIIRRCCRAPLFERGDSSKVLHFDSSKIPETENIDKSTHGFTGDGIPGVENVTRIDVVGGVALQKSRVSQICRGERSYHVFYQIIAGAPPVLKDMLSLKMASEYKYLNQSGCLKINGVDDAHNFIMLVDAFDSLGIPHEVQENVFEWLAAILWLGNITFAALIEKTNLNPAEVGDIVVGSVLGAGSQRASECRMAAFYAGFPERCQLGLSIDSVPQDFRQLLM